MAIAMVMTLVPGLFFAATMILMRGGGAGSLFPMTLALALVGFVVVTLLRVAREMEDEPLYEPDTDAHDATAATPAATTVTATGDDLDHHTPMAA